MKNYTEIIEKMTDLEELKTTIEEINDRIKDNDKEFIFSVNSVEKVLKALTEENCQIFTNSFVALLKTDRKTAFADLLKKPCYKSYSIVYNEKENAYVIKENDKLFDFTNLEYGYRKTFAKYDVNKNLLNKDEVNQQTIFDALRIYGLTSCFIRNLQKSNFEIDENNKYNLANIVVDKEKIFANVDGECFASNSNNALEKQLNIIVKFMGYDVKMLKKDLPILKIKAQKIKQDRKTAKFSVNAIIDEKTILRFFNVVFGVVASRINGEDIQITTDKPKKA